MKIMPIIMVVLLTVSVFSCKQNDPQVHFLKGKKIVDSLIVAESRGKEEGSAEQKKYEKAISHLSKAIELNPEFAEAYAYRSIANIGIEESKRIVIETDAFTAKELNPMLAYAYYALGCRYFGDLAINYLTEAIEIDSNLSYAFYRRGNVYARNGDYDMAIADYTQAIKINSDYARAYNKRGEAYYEKGDYDMAIADYMKAKKINPKFAEVYINSGIAYIKNGDYDKALANCTEIIKIIKKNHDVEYIAPASYVLRAFIYSEIGDYDKAITDYTQAIVIYPDFYHAIVGRGNAYSAKGDYDRAITDYTQAIEIDPDLINAFLFRGDTYLAKGDYDMAIADYEEVLLIYPDEDSIIEKLEKVKQKMKEKQ